MIGRRSVLVAGGCALAAGALAAPLTLSGAADAPATSQARRIAHSSRPRVVDVVPDWSRGGRRIRGNPIGLSIEWPVLAQDLGPGPRPPAAMVDALRALGHPALRIGGNSQDRMRPGARAASAGARWAPPPAFWQTLGALARSASASVQVGLDLSHGSARDAAAVGRAAATALPPGRAGFSLGNEPDRYGTEHPVRGTSERGSATRSRPWSYARYMRRYEAVRRGLSERDALAGPDFAGLRWQARFGGFLDAVHPRIATIHVYPLDACGRRPGERGWPTPRALLKRSSWAGEARSSIAWAAADAGRRGIPLVVSEANSVACQGAPGVSDGPASALWAPAFLLSAAQAGAREVDFHASDSSYDPFHVATLPAGRRDLQPAALFDGLVFSHEALGRDPRLVPTRTMPRGAPAWALRDRAGRPRVLVENLDAHRTLVAWIRLPRATEAVRAIEMTRAGRDRHGHERMAIAGRLLGVRRGRLTAAGRPERVRLRVLGGRARLVLEPMSAAVVIAAGR